MWDLSDFPSYLGVRLDGVYGRGSPAPGKGLVGVVMSVVELGVVLGKPGKKEGRDIVGVIDRGGYLSYITSVIYTRGGK